MYLQVSILHLGFWIVDRKVGKWGYASCKTSSYQQNLVLVVKVVYMVIVLPEYCLEFWHNITKRVYSLSNFEIWCDATSLLVDCVFHCN